MQKEKSPFVQAIEDDAKNGYPLLISQMKMDGRNEDYIKSFIDNRKLMDAKKLQNKQSTYAEPKRFNP